MAKINDKNPRIGTEVGGSTPGTAAGRTTTPVRNSAIPKPMSSARRDVTHEMIAKRAYEIAKSGKGGSDLENWLRAERELKAS